MHLLDRRRDSGQEVLAVVDHDQQVPTGHCLRDGVDDGDLALWRDAEGLGDGVGDGVGSADGAELDHPHAVRELVGEPFGGGQREPRLAHARRHR